MEDLKLLADSYYSIPVAKKKAYQQILAKLHKLRIPTRDDFAALLSRHLSKGKINTTELQDEIINKRGYSGGPLMETIREVAFDGNISGTDNNRLNEAIKIEKIPGVKTRFGLDLQPPDLKKTVFDMADWFAKQAKVQKNGPTPKPNADFKWAKFMEIRSAWSRNYSRLNFYKYSNALHQSHGITDADKILNDLKQLAQRDPWLAIETCLQLLSCVDSPPIDVLNKEDTAKNNVRKDATKIAIDLVKELSEDQIYGLGSNECCGNFDNGFYSSLALLIQYLPFPPTIEQFEVLLRAIFALPDEYNYKNAAYRKLIDNENRFKKDSSVFFKLGIAWANVLNKKGEMINQMSICREELSCPSFCEGFLKTIDQKALEKIPEKISNQMKAAKQ
ncbi:MAG: hypothetical protein JW841_09215 [Deltaproteobacteria bacterium]|nr:hypothetical protein [Deltaproteobacteria bacterium]